VSPAAAVRPSVQQQALLSWITDGQGSANLVARAGCGKTSTLMLAADVLAPNAALNPRGAFVGAYNKPIADEIKAKLQAKGIAWNRVTSGTMHSAGYAAWRKVAADAAIDPKKIDKLFDERFPAHDENDDEINVVERALRSFVLKAVSLAKQRAFGVLCQIEDLAKWFELVDHFALEEELEEGQDVGYAVDLAVRLYKVSLNCCRETIDYDDMILAPLYFKARFWGQSWVLLDEAQDTNPARRALALKMLAPGGRLIAVGDDRQAIYGFTGADADSMDLVKTALNSIELPLNRTYRCAKSIVRLANTWVPDLQAAADAPEGVVRSVRLKNRGEEVGPTFFDEKLTDADAVLCRKSAPLVELAYALLRVRVPCRVEGRDIGLGFLALVRRFKVVKLDTLLTKLDAYLVRETQKWLAKEKEQKAADVADQVETIKVIVGGLLEKGKTDVKDLTDAVEQMFTDKKDDPRKVLTLSTVHKSKGREWERVFILGRNAYMPSKWARKEWQHKQEENLMYVAVTRAKTELVDVHVEV